MKITPENIQIGDRITISGTVKELNALGVVVQFDGGHVCNGIDNYALDRAEITRPERPLSVGDLVSVRGGALHHYRVEAIYPDGFVRASPAGSVRVSGIYCFPVSDLTRIEETADDAG